MGAPAGLVRADLRPKPAYERLRRLIRERWWTEVEGRSDAEGRFVFRGFCGHYQGVFAKDELWRGTGQPPSGSRRPATITWSRAGCPEGGAWL
jgi:hypothetical protein